MSQRINLIADVHREQLVISRVCAILTIPTKEYQLPERVHEGYHVERNHIIAHIRYRFCVLTRSFSISNSPKMPLESFLISECLSSFSVLIYPKCQLESVLYFRMPPESFSPYFGRVFPFLTSPENAQVGDFPYFRMPPESFLLISAEMPYNPIPNRVSTYMW